ncbi:NTP transferase domain-containing protein [Patescibacteria group bacterium]|nr:NTP transferase domain-containing protein [Patescibacteria group bacterium]
MKAVILAAGRSKRMKPIEDKNFLDFMGKPLLARQIELVIAAGFDDVAIVCGAHNISEIGEMSAKYGAKTYEQKDLDAGMCGAVLAAEEFIAGEPVLIFSSNDVVEESAFSAVMEAYKAGGADSYILGKKVEKYFPGGYLELSDEGYISGIVEKPEPGTEPSDLVNLVVHLHKNSPLLLEVLKKVNSPNDDLYEVALSHLIEGGYKMKAVEYDGEWLPIKFPWHVLDVFKYFFEGMEKRISTKAQISETAVLNGKVVIEDDVKILDGAVVNGPCYIGKGAVIATGALVRESYIGAGCVIGFATEVARSYLLGEVWTHSNYIGDSVLGRNISFGAGTVTGNLRLDEANILVNHGGVKIDTESNKFGMICGDNVRFGINASIMPGVKIGSDSFIGAGIVVAEDVPNKSFVRGKWELKISENKASVDVKNRL